LIGVTPRAVHLAIAGDRLRAEKTPKGFRIDPVVGRKDWLERTHSSSKVVQGEPDESDTDEMSLADAERVEKYWKAKLAKLKYKEAAKQLVEVSKIKRHGFEMGRKIRDGMLNIPSRISAELMGKKKQFDVEQVMTREINAVLKILSDGES
jgi:hypothetical protein